MVSYVCVVAAVLCCAVLCCAVLCCAVLDTLCTSIDLAGLAAVPAASAAKCFIPFALKARSCVCEQVLCCFSLAVKLSSQGLFVATLSMSVMQGKTRW